jgi:hypothetical protein
LFLFGLDKRIDGKASSVDDFFSKVSEKLDKDNARILQQQVCYLNDGSGDFFVDCSTPERQNAFVDKVICIGYFVAGYEKNNDVFLHWQHREKCPEVIKTYNN